MLYSWAHALAYLSERAYCLAEECWSAAEPCPGRTIECERAGSADRPCQLGHIRHIDHLGVRIGVWVRIAVIYRSGLIIGRLPNETIARGRGVGNQPRRAEQSRRAKRDYYRPACLVHIVKVPRIVDDVRMNHDIAEIGLTQ